MVTSNRLLFSMHCHVSHAPSTARPSVPYRLTRVTFLFPFSVRALGRLQRCLPRGARRGDDGSTQPRRGDLSPSALSASAGEGRREDIYTAAQSRRTRWRGAGGGGGGEGVLDLQVMPAERLRVLARLLARRLLAPPAQRRLVSACECLLNG